MHRSPDTKRFHQENDNGSSPDRNLPAKSDKSSHSVASYPHLVPSYRGRSRRLLHQHVHYSHPGELKGDLPSSKNVVQCFELSSSV